MRFLSLFSGIGLIDFGLQRAGWEVRGQCEIEPFGQLILEKHWPQVWRHNDVRTITGRSVFDNCGELDAIAAGVPCQPASCAGRRLGADDDRWLWPEYLRVVSEINNAQQRPLMWLLAENPDDVLSLTVEGRSFRDWIEAQFQSLGYSLFVGKFGADCLGAPHERQRVWIVAHRNGQHGRPERNSADESRSKRQARDEPKRRCEELGNAAGAGFSGSRQAGQRKLSAQAGEEIHDRFELAGSRGAQGWESALADSQGQRLQAREESGRYGAEIALPPFNGSYQWPARQGQFQYKWEESREITDAEIKSSLGLANNGRSTRLARRWRNRAIEAIGNGAVVAAAEAIGRAILRAAARTPRA